MFVLLSQRVSTQLSALLLQTTLGMYFSCFIWLSPQYWIATHEEMFFLQNGFTTETTAKDGRKLKKRRKGQFQQSYILALSTHKSSPKPADIQITAGNYEGEDFTYITSWRKCQEVKEVSTKLAEKMFHSWSIHLSSIYRSSTITDVSCDLCQCCTPEISIQRYNICFFTGDWK